MISFPVKNVPVPKRFFVCLPPYYQLLAQCQAQSRHPGTTCSVTTCVSCAPRQSVHLWKETTSSLLHLCRALHADERSRSKGSLHSRLMGQVSPVKGFSMYPRTNKEGGQVQRERPPNSEEPEGGGWSPVLCEIIAMIIMAPLSHLQPGEDPRQTAPARVTGKQTSI